MKAATSASRTQEKSYRVTKKTKFKEKRDKKAGAGGGEGASLRYMGKPKKQ